MASTKFLHVWSHIGKTLKEFGELISPYITSSYTPSYKVYSALLTQTAGNDPVAIVLEDTINQPLTWYRMSAGRYYAESYGTWKTNKTAMKVGPLPDGTNGVYVQTKIDSEDQAFVVVKRASGVAVDDALLLTFVEIRVYN
jgi:hypothetical protein